MATQIYSRAIYLFRYISNSFSASFSWAEKRKEKKEKKKEKTGKEGDRRKSVEVRRREVQSGFRGNGYYRYKSEIGRDEDDDDDDFNNDNIVSFNSLSFQRESSWRPGFEIFHVTSSFHLRSKGRMRSAESSRV